MDKLTTLLACLPKSPFKDNLTEEIESLRQQLAAALAACVLKDTVLSECQQLFDPDEGSSHVFRRLLADDIRKAIYIQPDASTLKAHDDALIEKIAQRMADSGIGGKYIAEAIRD